MNERRVDADAAAVQRGMVKRIAAVLASEDVHARLDVATSPEMTAWTDFKRIVVRYRRNDDKRVLAAVLRGLMYHEGGHIRWTTPYPELQDMIPKEDLGKVPGLLPPLREDGTQPAVDWAQYHRAWNSLEDQRMETAVVSDAPTKAMYLTPMMMTELMATPEMAVANWPLTIWRRYLPRKIRAAARRGFVAKHGEALAQSFEAVVDSYVRATDAITMMAAVVEMKYLLDQANVALVDFGHSNQQRRYSIRDLDEDNLPEPTPIPIDSAFEDEDEDDEDHGDDPEGDNDLPMPGGSDDDTPEGDDEDGDDEGDGDDGDGVTSGDHSKASDEDDEEEDDDLDQDDLDEALADAEAERDADPTLDDDVESYHNAMEDRVSDLMPYVSGLSADVEAANEAEGLADEIQRSFQAATMDRMPAWMEQQHRGIINVARYEAARMSPDGQSGLLPGLGRGRPAWLQHGRVADAGLLVQHGQHRPGTGQGGLRRQAGLPAAGHPLHGHAVGHRRNGALRRRRQGTAEGLPIINTSGATNPTPALADLENQRFDKANHVVLIMTDGEWQG